MSPTVSVVIPSYNRAARLPAAIDSVLRQGVPGVQVVVVDDGSQDETQVVVAAYGDRVRYVYQPNAGVGAARNTGLRQSTGEFVAFLDSDDRWMDYKLSMQIALFRQCPDLGMVFSDFVIEHADGTVQHEGASRWSGRSIDFPAMSRGRLEAVDGTTHWPSKTVDYWSGPMYRQLMDELPILTSSVIVRRTALDDSTWYSEHVALFEDWEFFARVARRAAVAYIAAPTTVNVGHRDPGRVSKCSRLDRAESYLTLIERVWLADAPFRNSNRDAVCVAHGRALLAVAREALLAGQRSAAQAALERWQAKGYRDRWARAQAYRCCASLPGGQVLLRSVLKGRTAWRLIAQGGQFHDSVNPAA